MKKPIRRIAPLCCLLAFAAGHAAADTREFNGLAFVADGEAATYAWDAENRTLTLTGEGPYLLTGTNTVELGATWIVSSSAAGASLTVSNLVMAAPRLRSTLTVASGTSLHLLLAGTNSIYSAKAGIHVPAGASLDISRAPGFLNSNAVLSVSASDGAGIGGERSSRNGAIAIHGGTVTANAGNGAAGIGTGGFDNAQGGTYECGDITIDGGRVHAYGNGRGAGIGGGAYVNWQGNIRISGGVVGALGAFCGIGTGFPANYTTYMTTFITGGNVVSEYNEAWSTAGRQRWIQGAIRNEVSGDSGSRHVFTGFEPWQRVVVKNVSDAFGSRDLTANGDGVVWLWTTAYGVSVVPAEPVGVTADGVDVWDGEGLGWTYSSSSGVLELDGTKEVLLSGECATNAVRVRVSGGGETAVTVSNLVLRTNGDSGSSRVSFRHAIEVASGTTATLLVAGTNRLETAYYACGIDVEEGATLFIDKVPGRGDEEVELTAAGHQGGGIGSLCYSHYPTGRIEIRGGTVRSSGNPGISNHGGGMVRITGGVVYANGPRTGSSSAGIGAPYGCDAGTTVISGGTVVAVGGSYGAGIGGAESHDAGSVIISGGRVTATGGSLSAGIGTAFLGTGGHVAIAGGTVVAGSGSDALAPNGVWSCDVGPGGKSAACDVLIVGGSVHGRHDMITNAVDATDAPVVCSEIGGLSPGAAYSLEGAPAGYGMNDIFADEEGKIYVWCPAGYAPAAVEGAAGGGEGPSGAGWTLTTPVPVPHAWLDGYPLGLLLNGNDYETFGNATAENGRKVWECYVADLDPTDRESDLVAGFALENDVPRVSILRGRSSARVYRILGWTNLDGGDAEAEWPENADLSASRCRFFRIAVSLPQQ